MPENQRIVVILSMVIALLVLVFVAWRYASLALTPSEFYFTVQVTRNEGKRTPMPVKGAHVTLLKNEQTIQEKTTAMHGDTSFHLPVKRDDEIKVKVDVDGKSQDMFLMTAGFQQKFTVHVVD